LVLNGGSIELDEVAEEVAERQQFEETGLTANSIEIFGAFSGVDLHYVYPNGDEVLNVDIVYSCNSYSGELVSNHDEVAELRFFAVNEFLESISPPQRKAFKIEF